MNQQPPPPDAALDAALVDKINTVRASIQDLSRIGGRRPPPQFVRGPRWTPEQIASNMRVLCHHGTDTERRVNVLCLAAVCFGYSLLLDNAGIMDINLQGPAMYPIFMLLEGRETDIARVARTRSPNDAFDAVHQRLTQLGRTVEVNVDALCGHIYHYLRPLVVEFTCISALAMSITKANPTREPATCIRSLNNSISACRVNALLSDFNNQGLFCCNQSDTWGIMM